MSPSEHRDVLGALMNLGLKREKFGDIFIRDGIAQMITAREVADYVEFNVQAIGKATVHLHRIPLSEHVKPMEEWEEFAATVSSMRLDVVIAQIYKLSRTKVMPYIEKNLVKVNWKIVDQPAFVLAEGDYISVRGFGRSHIIAIEGNDEKG